MHKFGLAAALTCAAVTAQAGTVYLQTFETNNPGPAWSGSGTVQSTEGLEAFGLGKLHLRNDGSGATLLTLNGLAAHSSLTLDFNLAMWDSIDIGADRFTILIDGVAVYDSTDFGNYFPSDGVGRGPGTHISGPFVAFADPNYGYNPSFRDSARFASFTVAHAAPTVSISWQFGNTQGGLDESFGLDNVRIDTNAVREPPTDLPLPATLPLVGLAWALMAVARRRVR